MCLSACEYLIVVIVVNDLAVGATC